MESEGEKITISWSEIERVGATETGAPPPWYKRPNRRHIFMAAVACVGAVLLGTILLMGVRRSSRGPTVAQWLVGTRTELNDVFSTSNDWKQRIEVIHPLAAYKGAGILSLTATTLDGTVFAGRHGRNISKLDFVVLFQWEGPVNKAGYTKVRFVMDYPSRTVETIEYIDTNAVVNLDEVDWKEVGFVLGEALAAWFFGGG